MQAVRKVLKHISSKEGSTHAGLWLDKFLAEQEEKKAGSGSQGNTRTKHYKSVVRLRVPQIYRDFFQRWQCALQDLDAKTRFARVKTRMVVGLGAESVLETSITLHRTYGVPYIPGSALKGLAASYARKYLGWKTDADEYRTLFGDTKSAGFVEFFDALYVPGSAPGDKPLALDVITVHHPEYYQGKAAPADWDNPTPVPFVTAQGEYLLALTGPADWVDVAFFILGLSLAQEGIGAKTAVGYGRMKLESHSSLRTTSPFRPSTSISSQQEERPSKQWDWRRGKVSRDGRHVIDLEHPERRYRVDHKRIVPKGYTPPRKGEVEYAVITRPDGTEVVWVKRKFYPLPE